MDISQRSICARCKTRCKQVLLPVRSNEYECVYSHFYSHFGILIKSQIAKPFDNIEQSELVARTGIEPVFPD